MCSLSTLILAWYAETHPSMQLNRQFTAFLLCTLVAFMLPIQVNAQQSTQEACNADIDQSGSVDLSDYVLLARDFLRSPLLNPRSNISKDSGNQVDISDYVILIRWFLQSVVCTSPSPTSTPTTTTNDWNQDAHDAQRTGYSTSEPTTPWTYVWSFNGPDSAGGTGSHFYDAANEARTVVGDGKIYIPAGSRGLYALNLSNGQTVWNATIGTFIASPVYDPQSQSVFVGGTDGKLYKLNAQNGAVSSTFTSGSKIRKTPLLVGGFIYITTDAGNLYKVNTATMQSVWTYSAGSRSDTPPSYSASRDVIVFATNNLFVHAVTNSTGTLKWKVKPTPNTPGGTAIGTRAGSSLGAQFDFGWPVIADKHGVVFVRLQLDHQAHYEGPNGGRFASTNAENRAWLQANPQWKNLFALNLDDGSEKFVPAVGYGSTEDVVLSNQATNGVLGSQPIVRTLADGNQVAYIHFRNLQGNTTDYRWSGHLGEMVLDGTTVPGLQAGDMRFLQMSNSQVHIIDEQNPLTMGGNSIFHSHWSSVEGARILDRSSSKGLSLTTPITTSNLPRILRATKPCGTFSATTHYSSCSGLSYVTDGGRGVAGPAFYSYWNIADPPGWSVGSNNSVGTSYSTGIQPRYTYVSNGFIIVEGNGGDILVFRHS